MQKRQVKTQIINEGEALRYLENAREILRNTPIEGSNYVDKKPIREAFGTAYLAVLEAINYALIKKGLTPKQLPKKVETYRIALQEHLSVKNGKLLREFNSLYDALHIAGYYQGLLYEAQLVKDAMKAAERFIKKVSNGA
ncbi:MAG: DUF5618 family protein [Nitrospirae bacterium]|uniref:DUF5618 family protein n=1 Tax=Candidatus Magnetobacterium casense TaxID=1455061 RepID=UPI000697D7C8|nr:DUF5618 family protein [Candidatus Magnetobacterium casensis]MBF0337289.1 DUF5618 family protein [Nitrospirota bacterium]